MSILQRTDIFLFSSGHCYNDNIRLNSQYYKNSLMSSSHSWVCMFLFWLWLKFIQFASNISSASFSFILQWYCHDTWASVCNWLRLQYRWMFYNTSYHICNFATLLGLFFFLFLVLTNLLIFLKPSFVIALYKGNFYIIPLCSHINKQLLTTTHWGSLPPRSSSSSVHTKQISVHT